MVKKMGTIFEKNMNRQNDRSGEFRVQCSAGSQERIGEPFCSPKEANKSFTEILMVRGRRNYAEAGMIDYGHYKDQIRENDQGGAVLWSKAKVSSQR
ncbi:MAG: hypothetical protein LUG65_02025 [Clostridiales bacterium]|nr:hypothetical protein [Clostridiales bacterium]